MQNYYGSDINSQDANYIIDYLSKMVPVKVSVVFLLHILVTFSIQISINSYIADTSAFTCILHSSNGSSMKQPSHLIRVKQIKQIQIHDYSNNVFTYLKRHVKAEHLIFSLQF